MAKTKANALTELPEGYAITESINGQVSMERIKPRLINDAERVTVKSHLEKLGLSRYQCDVKGDCITVYEPIRRIDNLLPISQKISIATAALRENLADIADKGPFEPVMRFRLFDKGKRICEVQRMTYCGEGGWMSLHDFGTLIKRTRKYLRHLGKDSFYELM